MQHRLASLPLVLATIWLLGAVITPAEAQQLVGQGDKLIGAGSLGGDDPEAEIESFAIDAGEVAVSLGGAEFGTDEIRYADIVVRVQEPFLNRLIAEQIDSLNRETQKRDGDTRYIAEVSRAKATVHPTSGNEFSFSGSAHVRGKYQTKTLPRTEMVCRTKRVLGKRISWHEPHVYMDWMTVADATVDGSINGKASVTFKPGATLDQLQGSIAIEVTGIHANIKDFPGSIEKIINNHWREVADIKKTRDFKPFSKLDKKTLTVLGAIKVASVRLENEEGIMVLKLSGSTPRK